MNKKIATILLSLGLIISFTALYIKKRRIEK